MKLTSRLIVLCLVGVTANLGFAAAQESEDEDAVLELANQVWTGDLDGIVERGFVRVATAYNPLFFSYDGIEQRGLAIEITREFEKYLNKSHTPKGKTINVVLMPVPRDQILPYLVEGRADIAAANLTITPERQEIVAFSDPTYLTPSHRA